jgi:hypothetical protein
MRLVPMEWAYFVMCRHVAVGAFGFMSYDSFVLFLQHCLKIRWRNRQKPRQALSAVGKLYTS